MNRLKMAISRALRGPAPSRALEKIGIDPKRYWLLTDLFGELSERSEMLDQLGRDGVALRTAALLYFGISSVVALVLILTQTAVAMYFAVFLMLSAFLLLSILLSETANSLLNPVEGMVLAHHPVNGATYTSAKLTHLLRIIGYFVLGLNAAPALGGLVLKDSTWVYPVKHMVAALGAGLIEGLLCCALFGWLLRFLPARRLKAAGQLAATLPLLGLYWGEHISKWLGRYKLVEALPAQDSARWALFAVLGLAMAAAVAFGIRSLSADYLIRVSSLTRGGPAARVKQRRAGVGQTFAGFLGGQAGVAGFAFVSRMMLRDWQFRRQLIPALITVIAGFAPVVAGGWRVDPFLGRFTPIHFVPHVFGVLLFFVCNFLAYSNDYKGSWIFLLAPPRAIRGLARGIYALLWTEIVVIPHVLLFPLLIWSWGLWHAALFTLYSAAAGSIYSALNLRMIDGAPFSKQFDPTRGAVLLPVMIVGGLAVAAVAALQYFVLFHSPAAVMITTFAAGVGAYLLTGSSLNALEESIRFHLGLLTVESGTFYQEVNT